MKRWIITYITLFVFIPASLFSALPPVLTSTSAAQTLKKTIVQSQLSLEQSMADLSRIFDVKIEISGKPVDTPAKFNLNMKQATLEQAVKEVIRKANIQNYAIVWDEPNKTLRLLVFEKGKNENISGQNTTTSDLYEDMSPLTQEQLYLLAQQSAKIEAEEQECMKPLTPEQLQQLHEQSAKIEAEEQESRKPLTPEQLQQLKEQSAKIEAEEQESRKPLTPEQLQQLKEQSAKIESQESENMKPLSSEQLLLLQELEARDASPLLKNNNKNSPQTDFPEKPVTIKTTTTIKKET